MQRLLRWVAVAIPPLLTVAWALGLEIDAPTGTAAEPTSAVLAAPTAVPTPTPTPKPTQAPTPAPASASDPSILASAPQPRTEPATPPAAPSAAEPEPPSPVAREIFFGPRDGNKVALTFDDGPAEELTPWILNTLRKHEAKATFFVLGRRAAKYPELLATIAAEGHEIGNHGWSHRSLKSMFPEDIEREVDDTAAAVVRATGQAPALFRPPFGRYPESSVALLAERGYDLVLWDSDGRDWDGDEDAVVQRVLSQARPGAIILLHDRETATARALPRIIEGLRERGLEPVTISELASLDQG